MQPNAVPRIHSEIFPWFEAPSQLTLFDVRHLTWERQFAAVCLQGIVNRVEPRVFLVFEDRVDRYWADHFADEYGIRWSETDSFNDFVRSFTDGCDGLVVYDESMLHSANNAMTFGALNNLVPVTANLAEDIERHCGLAVREDFRGRWKNRIEAYRWGVDHLLPQCSRRIAANMCVDPGAMRRLHMLKDYVVATRAFAFDLSHRKRDRAEMELFDEILDKLESPGVLLGWHCQRAKEGEYVSRAAMAGKFVICSPDAPNLSVHAGVPVDLSLDQKHIPRDQVSVEDKIYLTFTYTDGDNIGTMLRFMGRNWMDSQVGKIPFNWEILPVGVHLSPAMMKHYYERATENDYFIAGPSGAGYTYPSPWRQLELFLDYSRPYLDYCDLKSVFIMNWDPRISLSQLDDPDLSARLIRGWPGCLGFTHNYFGAFGNRACSGITAPVFVDGKPYVSNDVYFNRESDVYEAVMRFVKHNPQRPLFVSVRARDGALLTQARACVDQLDTDLFKVVTMDEFLQAISIAQEQGRYVPVTPEAQGFFADSAREYVPVWWRELRPQLTRLERAIAAGPGQMLGAINAGGYDWEEEHLPDFLAYEALDVYYFLVRAGLNYHGRYARIRVDASDEFAELLGPLLPDPVLPQRLQRVWDDWDSMSFTLDAAAELARSVVDLAHALRHVFFDGEEEPQS